METGITINGEYATVIPTVSQSRPLSKMEMIKHKAEQFNNGELSLLEIGKELKLLPRQIDFCKYYTTEEFYGNGIRAYGKAYGLNPDNKNERAACSVGANNNLKHGAILMLINILLDSEGFNDSFVDKQLLKVITQDADLKAKMLAIKTYNEITGRVKKQIEVSHIKAYDFSQIGANELAMLIAIADRAKLGNG